MELGNNEKREGICIFCSSVSPIRRYTLSSSEVLIKLHS